MLSQSQKHTGIFCEQNWSQFSDSDHQTWNILFERQTKLLEGRVCQEILDGIVKFNICGNQIPKFNEINEILKNATGFSIVPVTGIVPDDVFFELLAQRKFPSTCFIRKPDQLDYLEEPDMFHDVYGHVPLLLNPVFADFMEKFGQKAVEATKKGLLKFAGRLYWFTVEFGLMKKEDKLVIYGAGVTSSKTESIYSLESSLPVRINFNMKRLLRTEYHTDSFQKTYFVVNSFEELFHNVLNLDWDALNNDCLNLEDIPQGILLGSEEHVSIKTIN